MTRTELIAALEAATGPSRDLDMAIELLLEDAGFDEPAANWPEDCPHYTKSIDSALSFTPEGWRVHEFQQADDGRWRCRVVRSQSKGGDSETGGYWRATPAIALCIANLKALEQSDDQG